eukprot:scaffold83500_cov31-Prasinocladus_malaysianus.AAC.1
MATPGPDTGLRMVPDVRSANGSLTDVFAICEASMVGDRPAIDSMSPAAYAGNVWWTVEPNMLGGWWVGWGDAKAIGASKGLVGDGTLFENFMESEHPKGST